MRSSFAKAALKALANFTGNKWSQSVLEKSVEVFQYLQGIGSGASVSSSGEIAILSKLAAQPDSVERSLCIFDAGANTGQFLTSACETLRGHRFHLHSFEPGSEAYRQLEQNARSYRNVTLNNFGLGREAGERDLFYDAAGSELASLTKRRLSHFDAEMRLSEKVRIETLDDYCAARRIDRVDLLKLDVEGHELDILNGGSRMFRASAIRLITFEFGGCNIDTRIFVQDFFYFFSDQGMRMARITPSGYLHELSSYKEILEQFRATNFVCYRP